MSEKKSARGNPDAAKKAKSGKEGVKLPALSPPASPSKKGKDEPSVSKPASLPTEGVKPTKTPPAAVAGPKPGSRSRLTKLSTPGKTQSVVPLVVDKEAPEPQEPTEPGATTDDVAAATVPTSESMANGKGAAESENGVLTIDRADESSAASDPPSSGVDEVALATAAAAAAEETDRLRKLNGNGMVKLIYEQYNELFPIEDGSTTQANIDEMYCLSFVMPNCLVRLSRHPNAERFEREEAGQFDSLVNEDPRGTYHDLEKDQTYYVVVEQEEDQLRRDQEATKARWEPALKEDQQAKKDDGRGFETCSCIYGNPCVDEYGCKDWHSRFAVATANGWKGF